MTVWPRIGWHYAWSSFHQIVGRAPAADPWPDPGLFILGNGRVPNDIFWMSAPSCGATFRSVDAHA